MGGVAGRDNHLDHMKRARAVMPNNQSGSYELKAVTLLSLGFALVGLDRFMISAMYPTIAQDLGLDYRDIGLITGVLAVAWGVAALVMGRLSDRIGRRSVLAGAMVFFSVLIGLSGLATGLGGLLIVRALMGLADGAYTPSSIAATLEASHPRRSGRNLGIQQMMLPLVGLGLAPLLVTQLLHVMNWRWIFALATLPGLVVAWLIWRTIKVQDDHECRSNKTGWDDWRAVIGYRNVRIAMFGMLCWLTCLVTTSAFMPSFLTDHVGLDLYQMGFVMSAIGFGGTAGALVLPGLSDWIGRKPVMILGALGTLLSLVLLSLPGVSPAYLFTFLFLTHFFNFALITLTVGPLCTEAVPPQLIGTASGLVIAIGEIFGGAAAPVLAGWTAHWFGIAHIFYLPILAITIGIGLTLLIRETATHGP